MLTPQQLMRIEARKAVRKLEDKLKAVLTGEYCGTALGYENGEFIIYHWGDAPVSVMVVGRGKTIQQALVDMENGNDSARPGKQKAN